MIFGIYVGSESAVPTGKNKMDDSSSPFQASRTVADRVSCLDHNKDPLFDRLHDEEKCSRNRRLSDLDVSRSE